MNNDSQSTSFQPQTEVLSRSEDPVSQQSWEEV